MAFDMMESKQGCGLRRDVGSIGTGRQRVFWRDRKATQQQSDQVPPTAPGSEDGIVRVFRRFAGNVLDEIDNTAAQLGVMNAHESFG